MKNLEYNEELNFDDVKIRNFTPEESDKAEPFFMMQVEMRRDANQQTIDKVLSEMKTRMYERLNAVGQLRG